MKERSLKRQVLKIGYLSSLHVLVAAALLQPGIYVHLKRFWQSEDEPNPYLAFIAERHDAIDKNISTQATLFFGDSITVGLSLIHI